MPSPGAPTLLLIPTSLEARRLDELIDPRAGLALVALCGFGPVAAAASTATLLERVRPRRVLLLGIAGAFDASANPPGTALCFGRVAIDGIGAGEGEGSIPASALGFPHGSRRHHAVPTDDHLALAGPPGTAPAELGLLLTCCAASADPDAAARRLERHPTALAEDMEGFGVALACARAEVPLAIVRGISNRVGDRDRARWRVPEALEAASALALELLRSREPWERSP